MLDFMVDIPAVCAFLLVLALFILSEWDLKKARKECKDLEARFDRVIQELENANDELEGRVGRHKTLFDMYEDAYFKKSNAEEVLEQAVFEIMGWSRSGDPNDPKWPKGLDDWWFDYYDRSIEFNHLEPENYPTKEQLIKLHELGFSVVWIKNPDNGFTCRYYDE